MTIVLQKSSIAKKSTVVITGSKSESNRLLLLQALFSEVSIENLSESDDTKVMQYALHSNENIIDVRHAGTAMRFLTAYFAIQNQREVILTGSSRMKERPIEILVDALNSLGADISYLENYGCPPLKIKGKNLKGSNVELKANVSSQYISALLLIAPKLQNGLKLTLKGEITSIPYINMTLDLLHQIGVKSEFFEQVITVLPKPALEKSKTVIVESDWSSASYFYSIVALSPIGIQITLSFYKYHSLQGDSVLSEIYKQFGVKTTFEEHTIVISKLEDCQLDSFYCELNNSPDIAQTIAVTCLGLRLDCHLTGLHTLKIKETDRLVALKTEIEKFGAQVTITEDSLQLASSETLNEQVSIDTYNDHRMAMAFAPLALQIPLQVKDATVVSKSFPSFWEDLKVLGFKISE